MTKYTDIALSDLVMYLFVFYFLLVNSSKNIGSVEL